MRPRIPHVLIAAGAVVFLWVAVAVLAYWLLPDWGTRGQFGDVFGSVNALFSGLAFVGLIYAILLQREDLELQRQELALTRTELARSALAQEQSEEALRTQAEASMRSAKLATINYLLDYYKQELKQMRMIAYPGNDPRLAKLQDLERRESVLLQQLDNLFQEIRSHEPERN